MFGLSSISSKVNQGYHLFCPEARRREIGLACVVTAVAVAIFSLIGVNFIASLAIGAVVGATTFAYKCYKLALLSDRLEQRDSTITPEDRADMQKFAQDMHHIFSDLKGAAEELLSHQEKLRKGEQASQQVAAAE